MSEQPKLGQIHDTAQQRDAVHVAVAPVVAGHILTPGEHVGFMDDDGETVGRVPDTLGVVDPYLKAPVMPGERFFLFLYPQTVTSLRHAWSHPAFPDESIPPSQQAASKASSEVWLRAFCGAADCPGYESVMALVANGSMPGEYGTSCIDEEYMHFSGSDAHGEIPAEFWRHAEIVLGRSLPNKPTRFSCSC